MDHRQFKEKKFWDKFANRYDAFIMNTVDKTYTSLLEKIEPSLRSHQRVLDIGTGTGFIPFSICSKVDSIVATDISAEMIRIAHQKQNDAGISNIDFQVQDSYHLAFPEKSFDIVIACNVLHLLYEPAKPLREVQRVLKDDGLFIAPTFCVGENIKSKFITTVAGFLSGFRIVNKWSINDFKCMLTNNGLIIEKAVRIDGKFPLAYIVMKKCAAPNK